MTDVIMIIDFPQVGYVLPEDIDSSYDIVIDSLFGFGFTGALRPPFDQIVKELSKVREARLSFGVFIATPVLIPSCDVM